MTIREHVLDDVREYPNSGVGEIADRLGLLPSQVSGALRDLREEGEVAVVGSCKRARWSVVDWSTPPPPDRIDELEAEVEVLRTELAVVDETLDRIGIPANNDRAWRLGCLFHRKTTETKRRGRA